MRTLKNIQIYAKLSDNIWVGLSAIRENAGHDDSLPYQADILIHKKDTEPNTSDATFEKVGMIWNDGWGGMSNIVPDTSVETAKELIKEAKQQAANHQMAWEGEFFTNYQLSDVLDIMADGFLQIKGHKKNVKQVRYYLDDERKNVKPGTKSFSYQI